MLNKKYITIISICLMISLAIIGCSGDNNVPTTYSIGTEVIEGEGSIELDPDKSDYEDGETVEIKAVPEENWEFKEWTTGLSGSENPESIVVDGDLTIGARFESETGELNINIDGEGSIDIEPEKDEYNIGDTIEITAIPDEGYHLAEWQGIDREADKTIEVKITEDLNITAVFEINTYDVIFKDYDDSILKEEAINHGDSASAPSEPKRKGYNFIGWSTGFDSVTEDLTITANYEIKTNKLDISIKGKGSYEITPIQDEYKYGDEITITAIPDEGYHLAEWQGIDKEANETIEVKITEDLDITVVFEIKTDKLDISINGEGSYEITPIQDEYEYGDEITITAIPVEGWEFESWSGDIDSTDNPVDATIKGGKIEVTSAEESLNITANFERKTFSVTTSVEGEGSIDLNLDSVNYKYEDMITITAIPSEGYHLAKWQGIDKEANENIKVEVTDNLNITAVFEVNSYEVIFKDHEGVIETQTLEHGDSASAPSEPEKEGHNFTGWNTSFNKVTNNLIVEAEFNIKTYEVEFKDHQGTIKSQTINHGDSATAPSDPSKTGYDFVGWDTDFNNITFDLTVEAEFEIKIYEVTFKDYDDNVLKEETVNRGDSATAPEEPTKENYDFIGWDTDFDEVTEDLTVYADFENAFIYYIEFDSETKTITGYDESGGSDVLIPAEIDGVSVKNISGFEDNNLTSVEIPDSVTEIGWGAFRNNDLALVELGGSVIEIGSGAFENNELTEVVIPDSVTEIGSGAFRNNNLTEVEINSQSLIDKFGSGSFYNIFGEVSNLIIGNNVTEIGSSAFEDNNLIKVEIGDNVIEIGWGAFRNNNLTSIKLSNSVIEIIGYHAFENNELTSVEIPDSVTKIGANVFRNNRLTEVVIPDSVTEIGDGAFDDNKLTSVTIPDSVTEIDVRAFSNNELTSVEIGDSVTDIGRSAFSNNELTEVEINSQSLIDKFGSGSFFYIFGEASTLIIGNDVTEISSSAFRNNNLTEVEIPDSVTEIGGRAFEDNNLTEVEIPDSVTEIGWFAFRNNNLTEVKISDSLTEIGSYAFEDNNLTEVEIPDSVTEISSGAFKNNELSEVEIPDSVTEISSGAFKNNELNEVEINSQALIDKFSSISFYNIFGEVSNLIIGNNVTEIGYDTFRNNRLTEVVIGGNVIKIGSGAFEDNNLTKVVMPSDVDLVTIMNNDPIGEGTKFKDYYNTQNKQAGTYVRDNVDSDWYKQ